ncbi:hypothetical protein FBQ85_18065 [Cytophagia bacterium CHB2]|nr:hypothetical protein [Cytophagia bacterium CHB2]
MNSDVHDATTAHKERGLRKPQVPGPGTAWVVNFNDGNCNNNHVENNNYYVRVVCGAGKRSFVFFDHFGAVAVRGPRNFLENRLQSKPFSWLKAQAVPCFSRIDTLSFATLMKFTFKFSNVQPRLGRGLTTVDATAEPWQNEPALPILIVKFQ